MQPDFSHARAMQQMRENCARDLPWFVGSDVGKGRQFVIVAGGPSLRSRLDSVRLRQQRGACVLACNGAANLLIENGITPDLIGFVDLGDAVLGFIPERFDGLFIVSSIVSPKVLDALKGRKVVLWHPDYGGDGAKEAKAVLEAHGDKPGILIGGGNTIAMRAQNIAYLMGFRDIHYYGLDSSYAEDGADHAYKKHDGVEPDAVSVKYGGQTYRCSPWMMKQAIEFKFYYNQMRDGGAKVYVHGDGLIPAIWKRIRHSERLAA